MNFTLIAYNFIGSTTGYYHFGKDVLIGGGEVYLYYLINFLKNEGHEVNLIQAGEKNEITNLDNVIIQKLKMPFNFKKDTGMINRYFFFNLMWKKSPLWKSSDRVHFHEYLNAFPRSNRTMTGTSHGINWDDPRFAKWDSFGVKLRIYRKYIRFLAKYAISHLKKIAANDTFLLRFVQSEMPQFRQTLEVILNFVDTDIFNSKNSGKGIREKYGDDKTLILYPRNFGYGRGGLHIIDAVENLVKKYPDILLLMTGDGPERPLAEMKVKNHNLGKNIKFIGHMNHFKQMPSLYSAVDIVTIPTTSVEGTSLSCLEAMATGKPVVVTNVGGLPDIVKDDFNGLVAKPNADSLTEKLEIMIKDKNRREGLAKNGMRWVKKYHNYKRWCQQYKGFFDI